MFSIQYPLFFPFHIIYFISSMFICYAHNINTIAIQISKLSFWSPFEAFRVYTKCLISFGKMNISAELNLVKIFIKTKTVIPCFRSNKQIPRNEIKRCLPLSFFRSESELDLFVKKYNKKLLKPNHLIHQTHWICIWQKDDCNSIVYFMIMPDGFGYESFVFPLSIRPIIAIIITEKKNPHRHTKY